MSFSNAETALFSQIEFPYSKELSQITSDRRPNLFLENENQSFYSVLKYIRNELIAQKLKDRKELVFDSYINDILGLSTINVDHFYPPENLQKLDKFITKLKENDLEQEQLYTVLYYILKDFNVKEAEKFITDGHRDQLSIYLRIPQSSYDLINAIYHIDRFDILKSIKHINTLNFPTHNYSFTQHFIRLANVIPYKPEIQVSKLKDLNQMKHYLEVSSAKDTSIPVISMFTAFNLNPLLVDLDILLIFIDAITDVSPQQALDFIKSLEANYQSDTPKISISLIIKLVIFKILVKTHKQSMVISKLFKSKVLDMIKFDKIYETLPFFQLASCSTDYVTTLYSIVNSSVTTEEEQLAAKYPNFFSRLHQSDKEVKKLAREALVLKQVWAENTDLEELSRLGHGRDFGITEYLVK